MPEKPNIFLRGIRRDARLLDRAVAAYLEPIAKKHGLPIVRIQDGIYEIPSPYFIQRLEAYAGHSARDMSAHLRKTTLCVLIERDPKIQYDIGWFVRFNR